MGNVLCKEPNTSSTPRGGVGNTFSNLGSVICPNGLGKGKAHPMRKTYFTRSASVDASKKTATSATGWQSVGLHVPDGGVEAKVIDRPPVAPPRKKRTGTLDSRYRSDESLQVKNGFQDVFGRESRRHSADLTRSAARPASVPPPRPELPAMPARQTSCFEIDASNDAFSDFSKVPTTAELERPAAQSPASQIPRVGNRKSDKFFGERLADSLSPASSEEGEPKPQSSRRSGSIRELDVDKIEPFTEKEEEGGPADPATPQPLPPPPPPPPPVVVERKKHTNENRTKSPVRKGSPQSNPSAEEADMTKLVDRKQLVDNQVGRRAEFLMAMLEDYNDSVRYEGLQPVEEPLIVPKRRKSRHICDDHDHLHAKLHEHEREAAGGKNVPTPKPSNGNVIQTEAFIEQAPRKPNRDFSRYKPIDSEQQPEPDTDDDEPRTIVRPVRMKQQQQQKTPPVPGKREGLTTSPPSLPPKFQKSLSESQFDQQLTVASPPGDETPPKAHTPRMLKRIISMPATEHLAREAARPETPQGRPVLTKSSSSSSFSAVDLQRTRISVERFTPEDYAHQGGRDELVKPKSKLTTRKISWKSSEAPNIRTPTPTQERQLDSPTSFTIGGTAVVTSEAGSALAPPEVPRRKRSDTSTEMEAIGERKQDQQALVDGGDSAKVSQAKLYQQLYNNPEDSSLRKFCLGSFIESSNVLQHHDVVNVLDRVYTASDNQENIIEQFRTFLEDQLNAELDDPNPTNPNVARLQEKLCLRTTAATASAGEDDKLENVQLELVGSSSASSCSSSLGRTKGKPSSDVDECFDPEFEKIEKSEVVGELPRIEHHISGYSGRRRDSIEYMSDWFSGADSDTGSTTMLATVGSGDSDGRTTGGMLPIEGPVGRKGLHRVAGARKESIEDVGQWFTNHSTRPSFGEEFEEPSRRLRRGSDGFLGYDLQRQYPFGRGRQRSDSLSAEMFEDITKLQEQGSSADGGTSLPNARQVLPPHPKRRVLEHRNSSDALLMKVLNRPHRIQQSSLSFEPTTQQPETQPAPTEAPKNGETVPLLTPNDNEHKSVDSSTTAKDDNEMRVKKPPTDEATGSDRQQQPEPAAGPRTLSSDAKDEHSEHSTLLKFLSKENLIE